MVKRDKKYNQCSPATALLMLLTLLWLTISTPFVYASQQAATAALHNNNTATDEEPSAPLAGLAEEKSENSVSMLSEYLHETADSGHHYQVLVRFEKCHPSGLYLAFHPEMHAPPPNTVS